MKARFIGDPNDGFSGPRVLTTWGYEFEKDGAFVEVSDGRFARHSHFETEGEVEAAADAAPAEPKPKRGRKAAAPAEPNEEGEEA